MKNLLIISLLFITHIALADVVINELHYNPSTSQGSDDYYEFLELYNTGEDAVDLSGWAITSGVAYTFDAGASIDPDGYVVLAKNADSVAVYYQLDGVLQWDSNEGINNSGETVTLVNADAEVMDVVQYDDGGEWPTEPDGGGPSLELIDPALDNNLPGSWAASEVFGGTPGAWNSVAGNAEAPVISNLQIIPETPEAGDTVHVTCTITSSDVIASAYIRYGFSADAMSNTVALYNVEGDQWMTWTPIPGYDACTSVFFQGVATDNGGDVGESLVNDYMVYCQLSIQEIQGMSDASPYDGQDVSTVGIVTAICETGALGFFIQDSDQPWSAIQVYLGDMPMGLDIGYEVAVSGTVLEYYGQTEITNASWEILSDGNELFPYQVIEAGDPNMEGWESMRVRLEGGICTNPDLGYGEWEVNDGTGTMVVDDWFYPFTPTLDECYDMQGLLYFSYGVFKIEPQTTDDVTVCAESVTDGQPVEFALAQNYPNPFNPHTEITYSLGVPGQVSLIVYDLTGQVVTTLVNAVQPAGAYSVRFAAEDLASGVYFYRLQQGDQQLTRKLTLLK